MWSDSSLFTCYQICDISYLYQIIKQKHASPENWSKCTYDLIAFSRRNVFAPQAVMAYEHWCAWCSWHLSKWSLSPIGCQETECRDNTVSSASFVFSIQSFLKTKKSQSLGNNYPLVHSKVMLLAQLLRPIL